MPPAPSTQIHTLIGLLVCLCASTTIAADPPAPVERAAIVGASASDGFGAYYWRMDGEERVRARMDLPTLLRIASDEKLIVTDLATDRFFSNPSGIGTQIVERALRSEPDIVVAVDFLFWFGYGTVGIDAERIRTLEDRLAMLEYGLALLDRLQVPIVVGDIPDMSDAAGRVLMRSQVPDEATRVLMNRRIHEWAAGRDRVELFPLSDLHAQLGGEAPIEIGGQVLPESERRNMLQRDELHPTLGGLIAILAQLDSEIRETPELADRVPPLEVDFETLRHRVEGDGRDEPSAASSKPSAATPSK